MGRALIAALASAGLGEIRLVSRFRSRDRHGDAHLQEEIIRAARNEIERLSAVMLPDIWITYHSYYKAPDLLGPSLANRWGIPYVLIEATRASSRLTPSFSKVELLPTQGCSQPELG